jgi:hypothetical protein
MRVDSYNINNIIFPDVKEWKHRMETYQGERLENVVARSP